MHSRLMAFLKEIDPQNTIDPYLKRANDAFNNFPYYSFETKKEFLDILDRFSWYVCIYSNSEVDFDALGQSPRQQGETMSICMDQFLIQKYGGHYMSATYEIARLGVDGGLRQLLSYMTEKIAEYKANEDIYKKASRFFHNIVQEDLLDPCVQEYINVCGFLYHPSLLEHDGIILKSQFEDVLKHHPHLLHEIRKKSLYALWGGQ